MMPTYCLILSYLFGSEINDFNFSLILALADSAEMIDFTVWRVHRGEVCQIRYGPNVTQ